MTLDLYFGPRAPDAADGLARGARRAVPLEGADLDIVAHALDHRPLIDRVAARRALGGRVRVVIEGEHLVEDVGGDHWQPGGDAEGLRRALCALWRADVPVRIDRRSARLHANLILCAARRAVFLTSANLTDSGLTRHHNCGIRVADPLLFDTARGIFEDVWRGGFDAGGPVGGRATSADGRTTLHLGAQAGIEAHLAQLIGGARRRVRFAMFTFSASSAPILAALTGLVARGVDVAGVVDGDQVGQPFDAVPALRAAGVHARYVPGALTGGRGRMHHKLIVVDGEALAVGTFNFSSSARRHFEGVVTTVGASVALAAEAEIMALHAAGRDTMPRIPG